MTVGVKCPVCGHEFLTDLMPPDRHSTLRSLTPVHVPILSGAPTCHRQVQYPDGTTRECGHVHILHDETDACTLCSCEKFVE